MKLTSLAHSKTPHNPKIRAVFHNGERDAEPIRVLALDVKYDFLEAHIEFITLDVMFSRSALHDVVLMNKDNVTVTLVYENIEEYTNTFKAIPYLDNIDDNSPYRQKGDDTNVKQIKFQLINDELKNFSQGAISGVFTNTDIREVLNNLNRYLDKPAEVMVEPHNTRKYKQMIVKPTKPPKFISMLQDTFGIYNSPPTYFYRSFSKDSKMYIYPKYNIVKNQNDYVDGTNGLCKVLFYVDNKALYDDFKSTYAYDNGNTDTLKIHANDFYFIDKTNVVAESMDNQIEGVEADSLYKRPFDVTSSSVDFKASNVTRRYSDNNDIRHGRYVEPTNNFYKERALLSKSKGMLATLTWSYSNQFMLYPNMDVQLIMDGKVYVGVIVSVYAFYDFAAKTETCKVNLFITRSEDG